MTLQTPTSSNMRSDTATPAKERRITLQPRTPAGTALLFASAYVLVQPLMQLLLHVTISRPVAFSTSAQWRDFLLLCACVGAFAGLPGRWKPSAAGRLASGVGPRVGDDAGDEHRACRGPVYGAGTILVDPSAWCSQPWSSGRSTCPFSVGPTGPGSGTAPPPNTRLRWAPGKRSTAVRMAARTGAREPRRPTSIYPRHAPSHRTRHVDAGFRRLRSGRGCGDPSRRERQVPAGAGLVLRPPAR